MRFLSAMSASEAKAKFYEVLNQVRDGEIIQVIRHSRPEAIVISVEKYQTLLDRLEDLEDSLNVIKAEITSEGMIPWEEAKNSLSAAASVQS